MSRLGFAGALLLAAAGALFLAVENRYQYTFVTGPSANSRDYASVDARRVDRWTGAVQVWACRDLATPDVAAVPAPPKASDYGGQDKDGLDTLRASGHYFIALALWRKTFPHVDPETLHVTRPACAWTAAR